MNIFTEKFLEKKKDKILQEINDHGYCFIEKAVNEKFIQNIINDVEKNKFFINRNWISGVYTKTQYYLTNILGCSESFYKLVTDENIINICDDYMLEKNFRLKAARYYETFSNHHMHWHTDNKVGKIFSDIDGLIFIVYLQNVDDGEFQYIKNSHKFSGDVKINNFTDTEIDQKYSKDIVSFKAEKGSLIAYNTRGIHRAKKVQKKSTFVRKSLFFQVDSDFKSSEPMLLDVSFVKTRSEKLLRYLGLGYPSTNKIYPDTSILTLPPKKIINFLFVKYLFKIIIDNIINLIPQKIKNFIKKKF